VSGWHGGDTHTISAEAGQASEEVGVLEDRKGRVEVLAQALRHVGDARADGPAVLGGAHVAAEHLDATLLDAAGAGDQRHQTRLAHAVRADQPDHAAGRQVECNSIESVSFSIGQPDIGQAHDRVELSFNDCVLIIHHRLRSSKSAIHPYSNSLFVQLR
jgi:hypothetical protein